MDKGKRNFALLIGLQIGLAITDGIMTYIGTPDLAMEGNPLVANLGLGWGALFTANVVVISLMGLAIYYANVKYKRPVIAGKTFVEYFTILFYNRPGKFIWLLYKWPKNWRPCIAVAGYLFGIVMPVARSILIFEWVLYLTDSPFRVYYRKFKSAVPFNRVDVLVGVILYFCLFIYWLRREYRINQSTVWRTNV